MHALIGQNGAGKSTLMKVLGGLYSDYGGEIHVDGQPIRLDSPRKAIETGIAVIHQEFSLVPTLSIAENILLGREPTHGPLLRKRDITGAATQHLADAGLELPLRTTVGSVGVAVQQQTEIAKALSMDARVLVMDEPTARLSAGEKRTLFRIIRDLAGRGVAVIYISHFLEEVFEIAGRVTVLRDGHVIATQPTSDLSPTRVTELMAGRELARADQVRPPRPVSSAVPALSLDAVAHEPYFRDVTLTVGKGEIVGVAGLVSSGRTRLGRVIAGADPVTAGTIRLGDKQVRPRSIGHALRLGIAGLPENRKTEGLVLGRSAAENIAMMALQTALSRLGVIRRGAYRDLVKRSISDLDVKPARGDLPARAFSGGNQQKLALAKVLAARAGDGSRGSPDGKCREDDQRDRRLPRQSGGDHTCRRPDRSHRQVEAARDDHHEHAAGNDSDDRVLLEQVQEIGEAAKRW